MKLSNRGAGAVLLAVLVLVASAGSSTAGNTVSGTPLRLLKRIERKVERPAGYDRDRFSHWVDADRDGCDTRREVLITESTRRVSVRAGCFLARGRWVSAYDGRVTRDPPTFDVDHVVPLAEAWRSGARRWSAARRRSFANDLGDRRTLRAVSAKSNRSKGDSDPSDWLPPRASFRCAYAKQWVAVKVRWGLSADRAEKRALNKLLRGCSTKRMSVKVR